MKIWVYLDGRQQGPFEFEQLADLPITEETKVWFEGLPKWYPAGSLEQLRPLFDGTFVAKEQNAEESTPAGEETAVETVIVEETVEEPAPRSRYAPGQPYYRSAAAAAQPQGKCPPTYLGWSIFLMICCCSPVSLGAVIASICTSSYYHNGRLDQARKTSEVAAWLVMISIALGFLPLMLMSSMLGN